MNTEKTEQQEKKSPTLLIIALVSLMLLCWVSQCSNGTSTRNIRVEPTKRLFYDVEYIIESTNRRYDITYNNQDGNTEQMDVSSVTWNKKMVTTSGYFAYISAQVDGSGTITCKIKLNGIVVEQATSKGEYVIATCSGRVP